MKLQTLKPRLQAQRTPQKIDSSWRSNKSSTERGYGYRWQKARERFLRSNPLCVYCEAKGLVVVATVVDHIIPHRGDQEIFWDEMNWQALCSKCHSSTKQKEENQLIK
ncbi:HNH endonuclease [Acinetobacter baumannii]|uniref:Putative HNH nuclease YajD n=1 Tax=Acinetobacter baumannii TaxID=470 RepID=A0A246A6Y8_ACIBA|nr:HNH endonuclease signature motif containing protein [Acinetobacter baumannii]MCA4424312.1 HNH endonuclease [Acinetobacter baumannii]MCG6615634.1 HNH endonuclease [Acinetobacter baumannii]MEE1860192.1 HNH endonuclease [Acinetobacter baumannii]NCG58460.1 HNH endonuclease [Acinetobacter baumannii]NDW42659.1 HNH endonuclease [Acinetobacter baumannii]